MEGMEPPARSAGSGPEGRAHIVDGALAAALGVAAVTDALSPGSSWPEPHAVSAVLAAGAAGFLLWRRKRPEVSFVGAMGCLAAIAVLLGHYETGTSVLIALVAAYSVGAYGTRSLVAAGAGLGFAITMGLGQPIDKGVVGTVWTAVALLLPFAAGTVVRRLRERASRLEADHVDAVAAAEAAAAAERARIARELHDIISHGLGMMILHAGVAEQVLERDPGQAREALGTIRTAGTEAVSELSTLLDLIRGDADVPRDPQPTLVDVERLVASTRSSGLHITLDREGDVRPLPAAVELNAFRVVQEGLTNAIKHASGSWVTVVLRYEPEALDVEVRDSGGATGSAGGGHNGLVGLQERVTVFGGRLEAGAQPTGGWRLRASFPTAS